MNLNASISCLSLLFLCNVIGAKWVSDLQSLGQLLEAEVNSAPRPPSPEGRDGHRDKSVWGLDSWDSPEANDAAEMAVKAGDDVLARLFKDLVRTSKRSWSRYKKGGLRSCFGVRLERIGSFSGLGC
ncbi:natriuretic peptide A-like [Echeneis naucrates]|nr:C-type natriuretic peptide 3-like [Echeneis naucrates]